MEIYQVAGIYQVVRNNRT